MGTFRDRSARLDLSFPVEFLAPDGELHGHCLNISESGLLACFDQAPELWTTADLCLHFADNSYVLPARVVRLEDTAAGLSFCFRHERDHEAIRSLLAFAAANSPLIGGPPF